MNRLKKSLTVILHIVSLLLIGLANICYILLYPSSYTSIDALETALDIGFDPTLPIFLFQIVIIPVLMCMLAIIMIICLKLNGNSIKSALVRILLLLVMGLCPWLLIWLPYPSTSLPINRFTVLNEILNNHLLYGYGWIALIAGSLYYLITSLTTNENLVQRPYNLTQKLC
ncbi:MAG: hypothetical protein Tsb005_20520 [Gammaproteobacteria bacterium]